MSVYLYKDPENCVIFIRYNDECVDHYRMMMTHKFAQEVGRGKERQYISKNLWGYRAECSLGFINGR